MPAGLRARAILARGHVRGPDDLDLAVLPLRVEAQLVADAVDLAARHLDAEAEGERAVERLVLEPAQRGHDLGAVEAARLLDGLGDGLQRDEAERRPARLEPAQPDLL